MTENRNVPVVERVASQAGLAARDTAEKYEFRVGDLTLQCKDRVVVAAGMPINLTNAEFNMLEVLLRNRGNIVTKAELTEAGLSRPLEKHDRSVDMHISNLRKKIGLDANGGRRIATAHGVGYLFEE